MHPYLTDLYAIILFPLSTCLRFYLCTPSWKYRDNFMSHWFTWTECGGTDSTVISEVPDIVISVI